MDAPFLYIVRWWVDPAAERRLLAWMRGGHMNEVVAQPGFLWARCVEIDEVDALGWRAYQNIYGLESRAALEAYFKNPIHDKFARERAPFDAALRTERSTGPVVLSVER